MTYIYTELKINKLVNNNYARYTYTLTTIIIDDNYNILQKAKAFNLHMHSIGSYPANPYLQRGKHGLDMRDCGGLGVEVRTTASHVFI